MLRGNKIKTHFGGAATVLIKIGLLALYVTQFHIMIHYRKDYISEAISETDFQSLGVVTTFHIDNTPFYLFKYKGKTLKAKDDEHCALAGGDCFKFLKMFTKMYF